MHDISERLAASLADRYRIERELGQGGMATVFLAQDLRHERRVALKVLKPELAAVLGADRFVVEIKTTASLSHPHILPLFDSGSADGFLFYVMPFVEGETLRDKLNRESQFGVDEAVRIACEVADALDYAHRHGVIHRDIKPENILLHDGRPMVADFGIALALSAAAGGRMTETGLSLGTPHYMSPEQATAEKEITGRSDVYSLASVLYEMLSGEPPHMGKTAQQIIMKIIAEPVKPVTELRKSVPAHVAAAVACALEKLPADRFASAAEFAAALKGQGTLRTTVTSVGAQVAGGSLRRGILIGATGATLVVSAMAAALVRSRPEPQLLRVGVSFPENQRVNAVATRRFELSRDGRRVVYVGPDSNGTQLWVRDLDQASGRPIPGTRDAVAPFFSPDGGSVGFITGSANSLAIVSLSGGLPRLVVVDSVLPWGADWGDDGYLYVVHRGGYAARVRVAGGPLERLTQLDTSVAEFEHDWPQMLPGGKKLLVQSWRSSVAMSEALVVDLESGERTTIAKAAYARYLRSGHVIVGTLDGNLSVMPFDPRRGLVTGDPVVIEQNVDFDLTSGASQFTVADNGLLLVGPGGGVVGDQVVWVTRRGEITPLDSAWRGNFASMALSPDATRLAVAANAADGQHIWVKQLPRGPLTRLTFEQSNYRPRWVPGTRDVAYVRQMSPRNRLMRQRADGSAPAQTVLEDARSVDEISYGPDGRTIVYRVGVGTGASRDVFTKRLGVDTAGTPVSASPAFDEYAPDISPDGRHVVYVSTESGRPEVYLRSLVDPNAERVQVSVDGGEEPRWAHSGREVFFRTRRGDFLAARLAPGATLRVAEITRLFTNFGLASDTYHRMYDVEPGDARFLMALRTRGGLAELSLISDWRRLERAARAELGK